MNKINSRHWAHIRCRMCVTIGRQYLILIVWLYVVCFTHVFMLMTNDVIPRYSSRFPPETQNNDNHVHICIPLRFQTNSPNYYTSWSNWLLYCYITCHYVYIIYMYTHTLLHDRPSLQWCSWIPWTVAAQCHVTWPWRESRLGFALVLHCGDTCVWWFMHTWSMLVCLPTNVDYIIKKRGIVDCHYYIMLSK